MTTRTAEPGRYFYDAAGFVSIQCVVNAARLDADVSLYMGGTYGCTRAHVTAANDNGAGVIPNWERQADRALRGYADGRACVDSAMVTADQWRFDYTKVPTIFSGVDFSASSAQYAALDAWHRGLVDRGDELGMLVGAYGQTAYVDRLRRQAWWGDRPIWVWGGSGTFDGMHVKQHIRAVSDKAVGTIGCTVDENVVWRPLVVWAGEGLDPEEDFLTNDEASRLLAELHAAIFETQPSAPDSLSMQWAAYNTYSNTKVIREWLAADGGLSHYVREAVITVLRSPEAQAFFVRHTPEDLEEIANAVVAALPPMTGGIRTLQQFKDAVDGW